MIRIEIENPGVVAAVQTLRGRMSDLRPAFEELGEYLVETTKQRFATQTAPDGSRWAPNSQVTIENYLRRASGSFDKRTGKRVGVKKGFFGRDGRLATKGAAAVQGKRVLHGESGALATQISYRATNSGLEVGSTMPYGAMQQFGGRKAQWPHLWGDIPARPFLGFSADDERVARDILLDHLVGR